MQYPLVSVIIPVYNSEKYLKKSIDSVLNQSYKNIEIIVVDDGSNDLTAFIVKNLQQENSSIHYCYQRNSGSPIAKNTGLKIARGNYIQFLDSDDFLSFDKIENQVTLLQNKSNAVAVCRTKIVYSDEDINKKYLPEIDTSFLTYSKNPYEFLLNLMGLNGNIGMVQPNAYLTPRAIIDKSGMWSENLNNSPDDDSEFFCRILLNSNEIIYDEKSINYYRKSNNFLSLSKDLPNALGALKTLELKTKHILDVSNTTEVKKMLAVHFGIAAYIHGSNFPQLVHLVKKHLQEIGISKIPIVGGKYFQMVAKLFGMENALYSKSLLMKIKNGYKRFINTDLSNCK